MCFDSWPYRRSTVVIALCQTLGREYWAAVSYHHPRKVIYTAWVYRICVTYIHCLWGGGMLHIACSLALSANLAASILQGCPVSSFFLFWFLFFLLLLLLLMLLWLWLWSWLLLNHWCSWGWKEWWKIVHKTISALAWHTVGACKVGQIWT